MSKQTRDGEDQPRPVFQRLDLCTAYPYRKREYVGRFAWEWVERLLLRPSPRRAYRWRRFWLILFGGRVGCKGAIRSHTRVVHPWLFSMGRYSLLGDDVMVYNLGAVTIGDHTMVSQDVYICAGTHDHTRADLPLQRMPIKIGSGVWICAGAFIGPGVTIGDNAVIGARAVVMKDVPAGSVVAGNPSRVIKDRVMQTAKTVNDPPDHGPVSQDKSVEAQAEAVAAKGPPREPPRSTGTPTPCKISVLIPTLNEEDNMPDCLESVSWSDDIVVFDSYSTDRTTELARAGGARVIQREFDNRSAHQNWAMEHIEFKHDWVLYLDADERVTDRLRNEVASVAGDTSEDRVAFYCGRKNFFMGRWIKHAMPPAWVMRLFKPSCIRFERLENPRSIINGRHGYLENYLLHYNFSKGITEWLDKHNKYSLMEAMEYMQQKDGDRHPLGSIFSSDKVHRRDAMKELSNWLPLRPLLKFAYLYVFKGGFLDGRPGLTYCVLQSIYEHMISVKIRELKRKKKGLPV